MIPVRYAITVFSGFLQKLGSSGSGMVGIEYEAHQLAANRADVRVNLYPWDIDHDDVAESLWRHRPQVNGKNPKQIHFVVGYSYGGDRALKFIRSLQTRGGCEVRELWLCDAVRRWDFLPGVAAAFGVGVIEVPPIVQRCTYYLQKRPRWDFRKELFQPAGHKVVAKDASKTDLSGPVVRKSAHSYIDNDTEFRANVLEGIKHMLENG